MKPIVPNLWFDGKAEEAAQFYTGIFPDSRIIRRLYSPADNPSAAMGELLAVEFEINGQSFLGINGGPMFSFTEALSLAIPCKDQAEVDRIWTALTENGGSPGPCGWCKDRFGLSWQVYPERLFDLLYGTDPQSAERAAKAMYQMQKIDLAVLEAAAAGNPT